MKQGEQKMINTKKEDKKRKIPQFLRTKKVLPIINDEEAKAKELKDMLSDTAEKRGDIANVEG